MYPNIFLVDLASKYSPEVRQGCKGTAEFKASLSTAGLVPLLLGYVQQGGTDDDWDSWTLVPALPPTHCHLLKKYINLCSHL